MSKKIIRFWIKVLLRAVHSTWNFVKGHIAISIILLISLLVVSYFSAYGVIGQPIVLGYVSDVESRVRLLASLFCFAFIWLLMNVIYQPVKLYQEQGGFLENPFDLIPMPRDNEIKSGNQVWASIEVHNIDEHNNVGNCYLRLDKIIDAANGKNILPNMQNLTWSAREHNPVQAGNQPISIIAGDFRVCDVAKTIHAHDKAELTMWFGIQVIAPGKYELAIKIYGDWRGNMISHPYYFLLDYEGGNKLRLKRRDE
jgi:hypothetical protein